MNGEGGGGEGTRARVKERTASGIKSRREPRRDKVVERANGTKGSRKVEEEEKVEVRRGFCARGKAGLGPTAASVPQMSLNIYLS